MSAEFTIEVKRSKGGTRTRIRHKNGNIVFNGGQLYSRKKDAEEMIRNLIEAIKSGNYDHVDNEHGRTVDHADSEVDPDEVVVDAVQGGE